AHCSISRKDQVVFLQVPPAIFATGSREVENSKTRCESRRLFFPVEDQRARHDCQRGALPLIGLKQCEHLNSFAQSHIVSEACAEAETPDEPHPAETFALVLAKRSDERWRRIHWFNSAKGVKFAA